MAETYTGVIDRIVDGETAVILLEANGEVIDQLDVSASAIPDDAGEGSVLEVTIEDGEFVEAELRERETEQRREATRERLDRLSKPLSEREEP